MDGLRHPVGDQPSDVYWKRRLAVLVGVLVVALLLWWILSALTSGSSNPDPTQSPGPTGSPSATATAAVDPSRACTDQDFTVATTIPASVPASAAAPFTVTITSIASTPCIIDPTAGSSIAIRSGNDHWFDSSTCTDLDVFGADSFMLDTGATHDLSATWNYGRDAAGCTTDLVKAKAGTYKVTAKVGGVAAEEQSFLVTDS